MNKRGTTKNLMVIWYHDKKIASDVLRQIRINISKNFTYSRFFSDKEELFKYLNSGLVVKNIVFVNDSSGKEAKAVEQWILRLRNCRKKYNFQPKKDSSNNKDIRDEIVSNVEKIVEDLPQFQPPLKTTEQQDPDDDTDADQLQPKFNTFKTISARKALSNLTKESLKFLLFQSFIEIVLRMEYQNKDLTKMWNFCHEKCAADVTEAAKIRTFAKEYVPEKAINIYTQDSCFFRLLHQALRGEDFQKISRFGCYLSHLCKQIEDIGTKQRQSESKRMKTYYRGQRFTTDIIQQFKDSVGHLISLNGLLSTTQSYTTSTMFAGLDGTLDDYHSVIFELNVDSDAKDLIRPYADISKQSLFPQEEEILFFMGFVWKIQDMLKIGKRGWYIELQSCSDYSSQLIKYIEQSKKQCTYLSMGNISRELGDTAAAANYYRRMLSPTLSNEDHAHVYFNMAVLAEDEGRELDAEEFYKKAAEYLSSLPSVVPTNSEFNDDSKPLFAHSVAPSLPHVFKSMAELYMKMGDDESAKTHFELALHEGQPGIERATVLNKFALFQYRCQNIEKAYEYAKKAVELARDDACYSEFKHNLDLIEKHFLKQKEDQLKVDTMVTNRIEIYQMGTSQTQTDQTREDQSQAHQMITDEKETHEMRTGQKEIDQLEIESAEEKKLNVRSAFSN